MKLVLTEEEQFLQDTAKNFAAERSPISHFRNLRDTNDPILWDKGLWSEMVKLGWPGILIPEEYGGSNFGLTGIGVILQECAKTLTPSPLFATGVLGAYAINTYGNDEQKNNFLPKIVNGEITAALAIDESSHHNPAETNLSAKKDKNDFIINGKKIFVIDGASADLLIVLTRTSGEIAYLTKERVLQEMKKGFEIDALKYLQNIMQLNLTSPWFDNLSKLPESVSDKFEYAWCQISQLNGFNFAHRLLESNDLKITLNVWQEMHSYNQKAEIDDKVLFFQKITSPKYEKYFLNLLPYFEPTMESCKKIYEEIKTIDFSYLTNLDPNLLYNEKTNRIKEIVENNE